MPFRAYKGHVAVVFFLAALKVCTLHVCLLAMLTQQRCSTTHVHHRASAFAEAPALLYTPLPVRLSPMQVWHAAWSAVGAGGPQRPLTYAAGGPALHTDELHLAPPNTVREHPACSESLSWLLRPAAARGRRLRCCICAVTSAPPPAPRLLPSAPRACEPQEHARHLACGTALSPCL